MSDIGELDPLNGIAIIGMAGRFPGADNIDQFWENLRDGMESITTFSDEELLETGVDPDLPSHPNYVKANAIVSNGDCFDARFFGISPREAEVMDPQQRVFLECAWHALESAGYDAERYQGRVGIYAGASPNTYLLNNLYSSQDNIRATGLPLMAISIGNRDDSLATQVSYRLNLKGPSLTVQTACSTSLVAVHLACQGLLIGECDMAMAGGVSLRVPQVAGYLYTREGIFSPDGHCRPFDAKAQGTVSGNGVGIVVLKRLEDALKDGDTICAVIKGSAVNNDGARKIGYTAPSEDGQVEVITEALVVAGINPETITYVEAHGTGTELGDPIEVAALTRAFRAGTEAKGFCALGSVKSNIGHLDAAAGVAGLIKTVLALKHKQLPPTLHFEDPNTNVDFANSPFFVNAQLREWETKGQPRRAGVSSLGIGGTNAHVILEEAPAPPSTDPGREQHLLILSSKTAQALETATANLAAHLRQHHEAHPADVAYTLQLGRCPFAHRRALTYSDLADAATAMETMDPKRVLTARERPRQRPVYFMFPGGGAQYVNMGVELYRAEPIFREQVDTCVELFKPRLGFDLKHYLYPGQDQTDQVHRQMQRPSIGLPALFVTEFALAKLWMSWEVRPAAMIGHSLGEYTAACIAGIFSLEDALALVALRGRLFEGLPQGAMLSVSLPEKEIRPLLGQGLSIAAVNSPSFCAVSGPSEAIYALENLLSEKKVACQRIKISVAAHSEMVTPILEEFARFMESIALRAPSIPYVSNVTGTWITPAEAMSTSYWVRHLRETVRFSESVSELLKEPDGILLEVGPGRTLSTLARRHLKKAGERMVLSSLRPLRDRQSERAFLLTTLGRLWLSGLQIKWHQFYGDERRRRIFLPTYPFARERYWVDPQKARSKHDISTLSSLRKSNVADWFYLPGWRSSAVPTPPVSASTTWVLFGAGTAVAAGLVARFRATGHVVNTVQAGARCGVSGTHTFTVNPQRAEDYDRLLTALDPIPQRIVYCAGDRFDFYGLIFLVQALDRCNLTGMRLDIITHNARQVVGDETIDPTQALVLGPAIVISQEYPSLTCRSIDISVPSQAWQVARLCDHLLAELMTAEPVEPTIAYRGAQRWVPTLDVLHLPEDVPSCLREKGVYLITGGLGRVGRVLARYLADTVQAKLVLTGRSGLLPRGEWVSWLETHGATDPMSTRIRFIQDLEAQGTQVLVLAADVADRDQMRAAIAQTCQQFGTLHGVLHTAGISKQGELVPIQEITRADCEAQFRTKVQGTQVLSEVLRERELDFCILFSSVAVMLGGLGHAAYTAANGFMDAFARRHNQIQPTPWISVNWDIWRFADFVNKVHDSGLGASIAELGMSPSEGAQVFAQVLKLGRIPQVVISTGDLQARLERWVTRRAVSVDAETMPTPTDGYARPDLQNAYVAPRNDVEERLALIWQQLLGVDQVGVYDNFFELSGHSLLATQLLSKVRNVFAVEMSMRRFFESPTVAETALAIIGEQGGTPSARDSGFQAPPIVPVPRDVDLPLSFAQQRLWFLNQLEPDNPAYNLLSAVRLSGSLDIAALEQSLAEILRRHEILRTTFVRVDGQPVQVIAPPQTAPLPVVDLQELPELEQEDEVQRLIAAELQRPFDLAHGPLVRPAVLRLDEGEHILLLAMHHIVSDGWSKQILIREMALLYQAFAAGKTSPLPEMPIQYADFAVWQRKWLQGEVSEKQLGYWKQRLTGAPAVLELPTDAPRPPAQSCRGVRQPIKLPGSLTEALKALSHQKGVTLFMTLLAAFKTLLYRYTGQEDIVIGSSIANRNRSEVEGLIGFFVNTLVLRTDLSGNPTFRELLARVHEVALGAYAHQDLPFEKLVEELQPQRDLSYAPLFQVMFDFQNVPEEKLELPGLTLKPLEFSRETTAFDLILVMWDAEQGLQGALQYSIDLFDVATITRMLDHFRVILGEVAAHPERRLLDIPLQGGESEGPRAVSSLRASEAERFDFQS